MRTKYSKIYGDKDDARVNQWRSYWQLKSIWKRSSERLNHKYLANFEVVLEVAYYSSDVNRIVRRDFRACKNDESLVQSHRQLSWYHKILTHIDASIPENVLINFYLIYLYLFQLPSKHSNLIVAYLTYLKCEIKTDEPKRFGLKITVYDWRLLQSHVSRPVDFSVLRWPIRAETYLESSICTRLGHGKYEKRGMGIGSVGLEATAAILLAAMDSEYRGKKNSFFSHPPRYLRLISRPILSDFSIP